MGLSAIQLEASVQARARIVQGFNATHTSILESVEVATLRNQELTAAMAQ